MTPEEKMQRNMEFIVEQQAQFATDIQKLQEAHDAAEKRMARLESAFVRGYQETTSKINALVDAQMRTDANIGRMVEAQAATDERLNAFINVVVGLISSGQNGKRITARKTASKKTSKKRGKK